MVSNLRRFGGTKHAGLTRLSVDYVLGFEYSRYTRFENRRKDIVYGG